MNITCQFRLNPPSPTLITVATKMHLDFSINIILKVQNSVYLNTPPTVTTDPFQKKALHGIAFANFKKNPGSKVNLCLELCVTATNIWTFSNSPSGFYTR